MINIATLATRLTNELSDKVKAFSVYIKGNTMHNREDISKEKGIILKYAKECKRLCRYIQLTHVNSISSIARSFEENTICVILRQLSNAKTMQDIRDLLSNFTQVANTFSEQILSARGYQLEDPAYEANDYNTKLYNLHNQTLSYIAGNINCTAPVKIFSPQCREGLNESTLALALGNNVPITTYGLEKEENGAKSAKGRLNKVILGTIKGSFISNESFDIVYANPTITMRTEFNSRERLVMSNEEFILNTTIKYLKKDGIFIYTIPFYGITPSIALTLSREFKDIDVFTSSYDDVYRQSLKFVTIIGRKSFNFASSNVFNELTNLEYDNLSNRPSMIYNLNLEEKELKLFRGSILDHEELDEVIKNGGLYNDFYSTIEKQNKPSDSSPLLPFNIGQIGLILSSGSLDGIVEESSSVKHAIKGMTIKETESLEDHETDNNGNIVTKSTQTVRNKVQITAIDATGELYQLA